MTTKQTLYFHYEPLTEAELQTMVADYLRVNYPDVLFHSDFGSGIKLTMGQAMKQKRQNGGRRAWPDMFIAEPLGYLGERMPDSIAGQVECAGLFIELKKADTRLKKKSGEWASDHIAEQASVLEKLRERGYIATIGIKSAIHPRTPTKKILHILRRSGLRNLSLSVWINS